MQPPGNSAFNYTWHLAPLYIALILLVSMEWLSPFHGVTVKNGDFTPIEGIDSKDNFAMWWKIQKKILTTNIEFP